jgi:hypothetical protein
MMGLPAHSGEIDAAVSFVSEICLQEGGKRKYGYFIGVTRVHGRNVFRAIDARAFDASCFGTSGNTSFPLDISAWGKKEQLRFREIMEKERLSVQVFADSFRVYYP